MPTIDHDYGRDFYIWKDGQRLRTRMIRTVEPQEAETNADFERRAGQIAASLEQLEAVQRVEYDFERRKGAIVRCTFDIAQEPRPVAVIEDERLAGGRSEIPRGPRGQGGRNN
jgi:hypothetical protein